MRACRPFPDFGELSARLLGMEIGTIIPCSRLPSDMRGIHYRLDSGAYTIEYAAGSGEGARSFTVLHETYEIIYEMLAEIMDRPVPKRRACREADRFAAAVLMQPAPFSAYATATGLDVVALRDHYNLSCAALTLRLGEVLRSQPMLAVLYERMEEGDPGLWVETPSIESFRATVAVRTPAFGVRDSRMLCGARGLMRGPRKATFTWVDGREGGVDREGLLRGVGARSRQREDGQHGDGREAGGVEGQGGEGGGDRRSVP